MKKIVAAVFAAAALQLVLAVPTAPVYAASLEQRLSEFVVQNPNILQQVVEVKQDWDQGNKDAALNKAVAAVLANNDSEVVDLLANGTLVETVGTRVRQEVESQVRQQVEERLGDKLLPYQSQISAVVQLFNQQAASKQSEQNDSMMPSATDN